MQLSFSFREFNAILTDLLFFTVNTIGGMKQSSSTVFIFTRYPALFSFSTSLRHVMFPCKDSDIGLVL